MHNKKIAVGMGIGREAEKIGIIALRISLRQKKIMNGYIIVLGRLS